MNFIDVTTKYNTSAKVRKIGLKICMIGYKNMLLIAACEDGSAAKVVRSIKLLWVFSFCIETASKSLCEISAVEEEGVQC